MSYSKSEMQESPSGKRNGQMINIDDITTNIKAEVVADSIGPDGNRLTTMVVTFHRFVLAEFNTHRVFSRNSASSRAIPVHQVLSRVAENPAFPLVWASEKPGMQGGDILTDSALEDAQELFGDVHRYTLSRVQSYLTDHPGTRLHKSLINRLLEPFMWHTVIVSSTEWENFFALRNHEMAQPEIRAAAALMEERYRQSTPVELLFGEWHIPFDSEGSLTDRLKRSVARCAWVSTMNHEGDKSDEACQRMFDRLASADPIHASPFEHQAMAEHLGVPIHLGNFDGFTQLRHMIEGIGPYASPFQVEEGHNPYVD